MINEPKGLSHGCSQHSAEANPLKRTIDLKPQTTMTGSALWIRASDRLTSDVSCVLRLFVAWMFCTLAMVVCLLVVNTGPKPMFFRVGPHRNLYVLGFCIDTGTRYALIVSYSCVNSIVRAIQKDVLSPWLINNVQVTDRDGVHKAHVPFRLAMGATAVNTTYTWLDWFMYMNILLAQADLMLIEIAADLAASLTMTAAYMRRNNASSFDQGFLLAA
jgi:hypothetical protein